MKKIENKKVVFTSEEVKGLEQTYAQLIFAACKRPTNPQIGYSWEDMKSIDKVDIICSKKELTELEFEDADFTFIKERVRTMGWNIHDKEILNFVEYIMQIN